MELNVVQHNNLRHATSSKPLTFFWLLCGCIFFLENCFEFNADTYATELALGMSDSGIACTYTLKSFELNMYLTFKKGKLGENEEARSEKKEARRKKQEERSKKKEARRKKQEEDKEDKNEEEGEEEQEGEDIEGKQMKEEAVVKKTGKLDQKES